MKQTLTERFNMTTQKSFADNNASVISSNVYAKNVSYYDSFCLLCADLNISLVDVDDNDFDYCVELYTNFIKDSYLQEASSFCYFWFN